MDILLHVNLATMRMRITLGTKDVWADIPTERGPYITGEKKMLVDGEELPAELFQALEQEIYADPLLKWLSTERMIC